MDLVSHAVLGAACAQPRARAANFAAAGLAGALGALAPDLDLLIRSARDPLLFLELHRQFTHSLVFVPVGAAIVAVLLHAALRRRVALVRLWSFCALGYLSHVLLDVCTSYGLELLWPFTPQRPALSIISVFDPLFTLPMSVLAAFAIVRGRRRWAVGAVLWALVYLGLAGVQAQRAESAAAAVAASRGHEPARLIATPSFANTLVWKTLYEHDGRYYVDAVRTGIDRRLHVGESVRALDTARDLGWLEPGTRQARDLARFRFVSNGYVALDPGSTNRVIELRYSLVPNEIAPYWALELDPRAAADSHARFVTTRERTPAQGLELARMVLGRVPGEPIE